MDKLKTFAKTLLVIVCCSMSGGCYMFETRRGEFFNSTRALCNLDNNYRYWPFLPTLGSYLCVSLVTWPVGFVINETEMCVVAPAYDILWMPYDCYKYIERAPERRMQRERAKSYDLAFNHLDEALNDERYLSPTNTIQRESLGRALKDKKREDLTSKQAARILAAIRKDPSMLPDLCHVAKQLAVSNADFEWIVNQAVEHKKTLKEGERNPIADAACESRYVTDAQYVKLANAGCSASQIRYSREERDRLRKMKELEIRYSIEGEKRKARERIYTERTRKIEKQLEGQWKQEAQKKQGPNTLSNIVHK